MKVSKIARKGARMLFSAVHTGGRLDQGKVRSVLASVLERRPAGSAEILHEFHRLVRLELESHAALVETAEALSASEVHTVEKSLTARFGSETTFSYSVNPSLIAGIRVKIGSDVYDASVRERLNRLKAELSV
jgi:F-type H+-transporting ATPase subunit delta